MNICIVGSGNAGTQFAKAFHNAGFRISKVISRQEEHARQLAEQLNAEASSRLPSVDSNTEMVFIAVPDDQIREVAHALGPVVRKGTILVHCSGNTPDTVLNTVEHFGVIWPPQSLSKEHPADLRTTPLVISGSNPDTLATLKTVAGAISEDVFILDFEKRRILHLGAVLVNNFPNHMYALTSRLLEKKDIPFKILHPIIAHGAEKIRHMSPSEAQTGPAIRGDLGTIQQHLAMLRDDPELETIYRLLSKGINPDLDL